MSRLVDWSPHWVNLPQAADNVKAYLGISFLCPHCTHTPCPTWGAQRGRRLAFYFWPPIIPPDQPHVELVRASVDGIPHENLHQRTSGENFDTLTIFPSVGFEQIGHWHGTIANGECRP